ncbi:YcxB family protein [Micromonospora violae]|uniref:YcxB family protein n=1 Tax=Micromonospora violae TaxID=1278207 RepID=UPI0033D54FA8
MELLITKPFDAARVLADLRFIYADTLRSTRVFGIAVVAVGAGLAGLLLATSGMSGQVLIQLAIALFGIHIALGVSRNLRRAVSDLPATCQQEALLIVTEEGITEEYPAVRSEVLWSAIIRVVETDTGWLLFYGSRHAMSVPKDGLGEDQEAQFRAYLAARTPVTA